MLQLLLGGMSGAGAGQGCVSERRVVKGWLAAGGRRRAVTAGWRNKQAAACLFGAHGAPDAVVQQVQHGLQAPQVGLGEHGGAEGLLALAAAAVEADEGGVQH